MPNKAKASFIEAHYLGSMRLYSKTNDRFFRKALVKLDDGQDIVECNIEDDVTRLPEAGASVTLRLYDSTYTVYC